LLKTLFHESAGVEPASIWQKRYKGLAMSNHPGSSSRAAACILATAGVLAGGVAGAEGYPDHPIKIIVPYVAGGSVDAVARLVAQELTQRLGQPVVVENKAGAGSNIGSAYVAHAAADGYTLLLISPGNAINVTLYKSMPYDMRTGIAPVAIVAAAPGILLTSPTFRADTLQQFVAMARKEPGKLTFGSGGVGSSEHLAGEMFQSIAGIKLVHVPYKGGAAVITDVLAGRVDADFTNQANVIGQITGHTVKVLAVAADHRSALLPEVPTFAEQGYPTQKVSVWWGIGAPAGTPPPVLQRLNDSIVAAGKSEALRQRLAQMGAEPMETSLTQAQAFVDDEIVRWSKVVKDSGAKEE
jgi:tripartite-type tricarboxylate transporter receptor subunit TctC